MRSTLVVSMVSAVFTLAAASAHAAPTLSGKMLGKAAEPAGTDTVRYAAWARPDGALRVYDARRRSSALRQPCTDGVLPVAPDRSRPMTLGVIAVTCRTSRQHLLVDARTGRSTAIPGLTRGDTVIALGQRWVAAHRAVESDAQTAYVNRSTGQLVIGPEGEHRDLDAADLPAISTPAGAFAAFSRSAPATPQTLGRLVVATRAGVIRHLPRRCDQACASVWRSADVVTWTSGGGVGDIRVHIWRRDTRTLSRGILRNVLDGPTGLDGPQRAHAAPVGTRHLLTSAYAGGRPTSTVETSRGFRFIVRWVAVPHSARR